MNNIYQNNTNFDPSNYIWVTHHRITNLPFRERGILFALIAVSFERAVKKKTNLSFSYELNLIMAVLRGKRIRSLRSIERLMEFGVLVKPDYYSYIYTIDPNLVEQIFNIPAGGDE